MYDVKCWTILVIREARARRYLRFLFSPFPYFRPDHRVRIGSLVGVGGRAEFTSESTYFLVDTWTSTDPWGNYFSSFVVWDQDESRPGPGNFGVAAPQATGVRIGRNACLGFCLLYWKSTSLAFWFAPRACVAQPYFTSNGTLFPVRTGHPFSPETVWVYYVLLFYVISLCILFVLVKRCSALLVLARH